LTHVPLVAALIKDGKLRAFGIASDERLPLLADAPSLAELGIPRRFATRAGPFTPVGTPSAIAHKLNQETVRAMNSPDIQTRFDATPCRPRATRALLQPPGR